MVTRLPVAIMNLGIKSTFVSLFCPKVANSSLVGSRSLNFLKRFYIDNHSIQTSTVKLREAQSPP